jgi:hypothetical protein
MGITRESACGKNLCSAQPRTPPQIKHNEPPAVKEATPCEKQKLCGKTFAQEVFFILHFSPAEEKNGILNLQRMGPPPFKESVPRPHSMKIENGKKEV